MGRTAYDHKLQGQPNRPFPLGNDYEAISDPVGTRIFRSWCCLWRAGNPKLCLGAGNSGRSLRQPPRRHSHPDCRSILTLIVAGDEGDTLVIDTVGVRTDRPYAMIDLFGTPYTKSLHLVERYRLRDYDDVKDAIERNKNENWLFLGDVFSAHRGKFLQ